MQRKSMIFMMCIFALLFFSIGYIQAATPQEILNQYIVDLQKNSNDYALREKIIRHVQKMRPAPTVPKEAERFMARGAVAMKSAKNVKDFKDSVTEFEKATLVAPWLANAYYNLGIAQEKAGLYDAAFKSLKLYLLASPNASDANSVEKLIYEIEYRQEKAQKASENKIVEEKAKTNLESLNGQYSQNHWGGTKFDRIEEVGFKGFKPFSVKPERNGPWSKGGGDNIDVQINNGKIKITIRAIHPQSIRTSAVYEGTITGTHIEGIMTESYYHRMSCPNIVNYRFEGTVWPEEGEIMLIIEDCYFDGNPQNGFGCQHFQRNCFAISYLLIKK